MGTSSSNDLGFVADEADVDLGFEPEPIDPSSWVFPRGMEHLDPARVGAYEMAQPDEGSKTVPVNWPNPLRAAKEAAQEYILGPTSEAALGILGFQPDAPLPGGITLSGTSEEALARSALSSYGANPPSEAALASLTAETGGTGQSTPQGPVPGVAASRLVTAADMAGQAPLYAALPVATAPAKASALTKAGYAALTGAGQGALSGLASKDQTALEGALTGAALGTGMSLLGSGVSRLLTPASKLPLDPNGTRKIADDLMHEGVRSPRVSGEKPTSIPMPGQSTMGQNVLVPRPTINESVLRAQLEREAQLATERARGIEIDPSQYPSGVLSPGPAGELMEPVEGQLSASGAARFKEGVVKGRAATAAQDTANYLKGTGPTPQAAQEYAGYRAAQEARGTLVDSPGAGKLATPESVAAAANAATPPPDPSEPTVSTPPVPIPPVGTLPDQQVAAFKDIQTYANQIRFARPGVMERLRDFLTSPGVRGEPSVRHIANEIKVAKSLTKMSEDTLAAVESGMGPHKNDLAFRKALSDLADGKIDAAKIQADHPEAWSRVKKIIEPTLNEIAQNDQILRGMGYVPDSPSWMLDPEISKYAARTYLSKTAPKGAWGRVAPQEVVDNGIKYIMEHSGLDLSKTENRQQIANDVLDMLNSGKTWEDIVGAKDSPAWTKPFRNLKGRQQLPKEIRALLGEIEDGPYRIAHTIGTQRSLIATLSAAREVALNPQWTANGPVMGPTGKWVQMPNVPSMGPLAGKWVRPDIAEAFGNAAYVAPRTSWITSKLMRFFKANVTVFGGTAAWSHELIGNLDNAMLSGGFDITRPLATGKAFMRADKALRAYFKNPSSPEAQEMLEVFRLGAADMGWSRAEMRQANQNMINIMEKELKRQKGESFWNVMDALPAIMKAGQKVYAKSGQAWDMISLHMRTACYFNLRDKFILQGMAVPEARRLAAQRVIMSFPSPHNLSAGVENLRNSAVGFIAPFTTYLAEDVRIRLQIPQRIAEGEADLPIRMAIHYGILGGAIAGASAYGMHKYGITKEELAAANAEVTRQQGYFRPMQWAIPIRDDKGRITVTDFTWANPAFRLPQGDIVDPLYKRLATNTLLYPFEGGMLEQPLRNLAQAAGGAQVPQQMQLRPGEAGLTVFLQQLNRSGFGGPAAFTRLQQLAKQAGQTENVSPFQETLTPGEVAANLAGFPTKAVTVPTGNGGGSKAMASRALEFQRSMKDLTMALRQAVASGDQDRALRVRAMIDATIADFKNVGQKVEAAQKAKEK